MAATSALRQALAAALVAVGEPFRESPLHPQAFARTPDSIAHGAFCIDLPDDEEGGTRQRDSMRLQESVVVQFWARVVPSAQRDSFDTALGLRDTARDALVQSHGTAPNVFDLRFLRSTLRLTEAGDFQLVTLTFAAIHAVTF